MITQGIQNNLIYNLYKSGCYFLSLCAIIEKVNDNPIDVLGFAQKCIDKGLITEDFYIKDAQKLLLFGFNSKHGCVVLKATDYPFAANYIIEVWYNEDTRLTHYRLQGLDTISSSNTVRNGKLKEYRAIYVA